MVHLLQQRKVMIVAEKKLTAKQQRFCDEYLIDLNATQAAIRAGYSEKTAKQIGQENLTKPDLKEYIEKRMAEKEESLIAKQDEVMRYLTSVMRRELNESVVVTLQSKTEKWVKVEGSGQLKKQTVTEETPAVVPIPAKLSDANKAAELIGKRYGMFKDSVKLDVTPVVIGGDDGLED
jgi:phage terminase small subunit